MICNLNTPLIYWHTIKYLKPLQIYYRLYYGLKHLSRNIAGKSYKSSIKKTGYYLNLFPPILRINSYSNNTFTFLNHSKEFAEIDWQFSGFGKLWCYNLNYFDFINQKEILVNDGLRLIKDFINKANDNRIGLEPYPISVRVINWIKFITRYNIREEMIDNALYAQVIILSKNIEYHLMGNHLFENASALLFAGYYFHDKKLCKGTERLLIKELYEQILPDGGHFELSPMYHLIILERVLDCINLIKNNLFFEGHNLLKLLYEKVSLMLGWIKEMNFANGDIPLVNDSAYGIALDLEDILSYAKSFGVQEKTIRLKESGYRKIRRSNYEILIDVGNIGPDYIPGHGHSDTFNFILYIDRKPFIVDTGVSTYEISPERQYQRSTSAHNTVQIGSYEQSEIWASFRMGRRAHIIDKEETENFICATHDGYKRIGALHTRKYEFLDKLIRITDNIRCKAKHTSYAYIHFYPDVFGMIKDNTMFFDSKKIIISGCDAIQQGEYDFATGFNKLVKAIVIVIVFSNNLHIEIST